MDSTINDSACLSNKGHAEFSEAVIVAAPANNGLVWLNWESENVDALRTWMNGQLLAAPNLQDLFAELLVWLDLWDELGGDPPYWPLDPDYTYSHWTWTGVCGHVPSLGEWGHEVRTAVGCPSTMLAQFDDLTLADLDYMESGGLVTGRCVFPYVIDQALPNSAFPSPVPGWSTGAPHTGKDGDLFLDVTLLDEDTQRAWLEAVDFAYDEQNGRAGYRITARNELGRNLLEATRVPSNSLIFDVGQSEVREDVLSEDGELLVPKTSVLELALEAGRLLDTGEMIPIALLAPDGSYLHRYVSPYYGSSTLDD